MHRSTNPVHGGLFVVRNISLVLTVELSHLYKWSVGSQLRSCSSTLTKKGEREPPSTEPSWDPAGSPRFRLGAVARTVRGLKGDNHNGEVSQTEFRQETGGKPSGEGPLPEEDSSPATSHGKTQSSLKKGGLSKLVNLTPRTDGKYVNLTEMVADLDVLLAAYDQMKLSQRNAFHFDSSKIAMCKRPACADRKCPPGGPAAQRSSRCARTRPESRAIRVLPALEEPVGHWNWFENASRRILNGSYRFKPSIGIRRVFPNTYKIQKPVESRPVVSPRDQVVQEAIRMVLERIYESQFCDCSHGFRPTRGCHTALKEIKHTWIGISWLLEFKIKFDRININRLIYILKDKIHDQRFLDLINKMFNCGMIGVSLGSPLPEHTLVLSPLLCNIYLHPLDLEALEIKKEYETKREHRRLNTEFHKAVKVTSAERRQLKDDPEQITALKVGRERAAIRRGLTREDYRDESFIRVNYIRYADELLLGIAGSRQLVEILRDRILYFLKATLNLEVSLSNYVHVTGGRVEFLGVYIYGVSALKWPVQLTKSIEKRRRVKNRLKILAEHRKEALANHLRNLVLNAWAWGLKKSKRIDGPEAAKQAMYAKASTFEVGKIESSEILKQLLKEEKDVFSRTAWRDLPEEVSKAYENLFEVLEQQIHQENFAPRHKPRITRHGIRKAHPLQIIAPLEQLKQKLRNKGVITRRKSRPSVVGTLLHLPDEKIIRWFSSLAYGILQYYRCCDNFYMVKNLVDYQIRWAAVFTLTAKHKRTTKKTLNAHTRDLRITDAKGTELASFPSGSLIKAMSKTFLGNVKRGVVETLLRRTYPRNSPESVGREEMWYHTTRSLRD